MRNISLIFKQTLVRQRLNFLRPCLVLLFCSLNACVQTTEPVQKEATHKARYDANWPSEQQISFVENKLKSFPRASLVSTVEWYAPLATVSGASRNTQLTQPPNSHDWSEVLALAEKHQSHAVIIWQNQEIKLEKYWPGFNEHSRYDTASMHKTVVALLTGIAIDKGLIDSVDDPLTKYLPELKGTDRTHITLRSLLEMSSGISAPPRSGKASDLTLQSYLGNDLWQAYLRWPASKKPFEEFYYANANPQYLGWVIERVTGSYQQFLSETLWQPMAADDARVWLDRDGGSPRTSCCLQASARDWLKFGLVLLNKGKIHDKQIVSSQWVERMLSPTKTNPNYGWQTWLGSPHLKKRHYNRDTAFFASAAEAFSANDVAFLDGSGGQRVYVIPSENMVIVRIGKPSIGTIQNFQTLRCVSLKNNKLVPLKNHTTKTKNVNEN